MGMPYLYGKKQAAPTLIFQKVRVKWKACKYITRQMYSQMNQQKMKFSEITLRNIQDLGKPQDKHQFYLWRTTKGWIGFLFLDTLKDMIGKQTRRTINLAYSILTIPDEICKDCYRRKWERTVYNQTVKNKKQDRMFEQVVKQKYHMPLEPFSSLSTATGSLKV